MKQLITAGALSTLLYFLAAASAASAQDLAVNSQNPTREISAGVVSLDNSRLIHGDYTTYLSYSLTGNFNEACILLKNDEKAVTKRFYVGADENGYIIIPAYSLPEGTYTCTLVVDNENREVRNIRVVR
ncbi:MAG: hypothetical protein K1X63_07940 [Chitinophagales bacterium]|nr:hypothetical protein [Chitinophagales bacterium]